MRKGNGQYFCSPEFLRIHCSRWCYRESASQGSHEEAHQPLRLSLTHGRSEPLATEKAMWRNSSDLSHVEGLGQG